MLRAARRLLVTGGRTAFFTISLARGLSRADRRRAVRMGPRAVSSDRPQSELMRLAGFADVVEIDVTKEFLEAARRWLRYSTELEGGLRASLGNEVVDEQLADRAEMVRAIEEGLLVRSLLVGTSPLR